MSEEIKKIADPIELLREIEAYLSFRLLADTPSMDASEMRKMRLSVDYCLFVNPEHGHE